MKVKKIKVQIKSLDEALDEFVSTAKKIKKGEKLEVKKGLFVADPETARALFTDERLRIIKILKSKKPASIYALAKLLNRDFKNVYGDITFLAQIGIIGIEESTTGRKQKKPILLCDKILFEIAA